MRHYLQEDTISRRIRLKEILQQKCRRISDENIDIIMSRLNINRIYLIKNTSSSVKFLNIITAESIFMPEKKTLSYIIPILGDFEPGYYINIENNRQSVPGVVLKNSTCAALKMTISLIEGHLKITYTLAVYEPA